MKRLWHVPWLLCSLIGSFLIISALDPFAGPDGTGILVVLLLGALTVSHVAAGILGFFLVRRTAWRPVPVLLIALIPTALFAASKGRDAWYLKHQAVYDRFRENVADPIPASVGNLRFVSFDESHSTHLMLRFSISPEDLDKIIRSKGFTQIKPTQFRQPDDLFTHPEYLPLAEPATYYIVNDVKAGYPDKGIGEGYTIKVSADRREVIFRRESAAYYFYRYWESDFERRPAQEFLDTLSRRTATQTTSPGTTGSAP